VSLNNGVGHMELQKGSLRSLSFSRNLLPRCEKTDLAGSVLFGILTSLVAPVSPFMIAHIVKALQVFLLSVWIKMFWTE